MVGYGLAIRVVFSGSVDPNRNPNNNPNTNLPLLP